MKEESNAAMDRCMKDWEDLSAEYLVTIFFYKTVSNISSYFFGKSDIKYRGPKN